MDLGDAKINYLSVFTLAKRCFSRKKTNNYAQCLSVVVPFNVSDSELSVRFAPSVRLEAAV